MIAACTSQPDALAKERAIRQCAPFVRTRLSAFGSPLFINLSPFYPALAVSGRRKSADLEKRKNRSTLDSNWPTPLRQ
jgi:hypothetical protein